MFGMVLLTLSIICIFSISIFSELNKKIIKAPCVDGDGDKNLEGIMCEKTITPFNEEYFLIPIIMLIIGILFIAIELIL